MTREEAIARFKGIKDSMSISVAQSKFYKSKAELNELCDMAISALSEEEKLKTQLANCHKEILRFLDLNMLTEDENEVVETDDEVIDHDREWIIGCIKHDGFIKTDRFDKANQIILDALEVQNFHINTEPSDLIRQETIKELGDWLEQMIQHGVPSHSAKRKALANAIALLSMDTHEIHTETHECVKETHDSDLISREDLLKKAEKGNITKYSTNSVNIITTDVVTVENIKKAPSEKHQLSEETSTMKVDISTNTPTDLISRADAAAYPLGFDHYDKENGSREFISGVESYREYIQHLPSVSAEPTTRERKEAKSTLLTLKHLFEDEEILKALDVAIECVSAERVGEWLYVENEPYSECSKCGRYIDDLDEEKYNFCPYCGAKMKGGAE